MRQVAWLMLKRIFTIPNGLILLWVLALWWGERMVFRDSIEQCAWEGWERWVSVLFLLLNCFDISFVCVNYSLSNIPRGSLKEQRRIVSHSSQILNWLILIRTPVDLGLFRL